MCPRICCLQTLTSVQEAILDTESYPWAPDIWQISCLLASARGQQDKGQVPDLKLAGPALASLLPHSTAFTLLTEPLMAQGLALKLKRECADVACCPAGSVFRKAGRGMHLHSLQGGAGLVVNRGRCISHHSP